MVLQEYIFIIYQRLEAAESALILTITTCFVGPTNFESSSIHNYRYTCLHLPDKFPKLFVLLRRNFNELLKSSLHYRRQSTYKSCCSIIKSHTIYAFIYMIAWLLANSHCCAFPRISELQRQLDDVTTTDNTRPVVSCNAQLACMTGSVAARKHTNTDPVITMRAAALRKPLFSSTW